jgi:toxin-antitoxin system PIN domain toxin
VTAYLLDANVLIALTVAEHEHHDRVSRWAATITSFALCPIIEGALIRYLVRIGEPVQNARTVLAAVRSLPSGEFWPDTPSYLDVDLSAVRGHRHVTDAYLVGVARDRGGLLATLDESLAAGAPDATVLVPA